MARKKSRFQRCVAEVSKRPGVRSPEGVCAAAGRKKYGAAGMAKMAAAGKKRNGLPQRVASLVQRLGYGRYGAAVERAEQMNPGALRQLEQSLQRIAAERRRRNPAAGRHNPADAAAAAFEDFHGRPSTEVIELVEDVHEHEHLASIGELITLGVWPAGFEELVDITGLSAGKKKHEKCWLSENEKRTQLYIRGGDQSVNPEDFGILPPFHETEVLGLLVEVVYYTRKDHLADEGGVADYHHVFGYDPSEWDDEEWDGDLDQIEAAECPTLIYKVRSKLLEVAGGVYTIPAEGITG